jgi:hypothetical protein
MLYILSTVGKLISHPKAYLLMIIIIPGQYFVQRNNILNTMPHRIMGIIPWSIENLPHFCDFGVAS